MKTWLYILILLLMGKTFPQQLVEYHWDNDNNTLPLSSNQSIIHLTTWQLKTDGTIRSVKIPFVISGVQKLQLKTSFHLKRKNDPTAFYLYSGGIRGSAIIHLNGHLISVLGNAQQPFKIALPDEFLTDDSLQHLSIQIKQPQSTSEGFPLIAYTYSESHAIGAPTPLSVVEEPFPSVDQFKHKLRLTDNGFTLSYSYKLNLKRAFKRIQLDELFLNSGSSKPLFHKLRYTKDFNRSSLSINGEFPIDKRDLWTPENPQFITLRLTISLSGNQKLHLIKSILFGARSFKWQKNKFYLNGKKIEIHGITYHQNYRRLKNGSYRQEILTDLKRIKALNNNAVRVAHFLPDEQFLQVADSLGLLVFAEFPLWRFPSSFFSENYLLELAKNSSLQMAPFYRRHPSLVAIGLGQEIPIHDPITQKFIFILNGKIKSLLDVQTYVSPIPGHPLPPEKVSDLYVFDRYSPLDVLNESQTMHDFALIGKIGVLTADMFKQEKMAGEHEINRSYFLKKEIGKVLLGFKANGGFIESYQDWFTPFPSLVSENGAPPYIIPQGLYFADGRPKPWIKLIEKPWQVDETSVTQTKTKTHHPTNFFSILITLTIVLFFSLYRRMPRLKENLKRSLRHSYGFFVDLRERRIIPLFNSILVGILFSIILAVFIASQIYYNYSSYWMQEIMAIFFVPLNLFDQYLRISQSYWLLTFVLFLTFFLLPVIGSIVLKLFAGFTRTKIRLRQGIAVMFWSGAPFLWFFPISLISYHWVFYHQNVQILWILFLFFVLWVHIRLIKGVRILFIASTSTVLIILLLCYSIPLLIFWALFNPPSYWFDYLKLLMEAKALF